MTKIVSFPNAAPMEHKDGEAPTPAINNPDYILDTAKSLLQSVLVIGITKEGNLYFSSSSELVSSDIMLVERFKHVILSAVQSTDPVIDDEEGEA